MTHLSWNCRGIGGSLRSSTSTHLSRLLTATKAQVCFLSETRNHSITSTSIKNRFNINDAFVVPSQGQSGGLWLLWTDEVTVSIVEYSQNFIFAMCINNVSHSKYGLVCIYGDPHRRSTDVIWNRVLAFVATNATVPMLCMGDLNNIMNANEKFGPNPANNRCINAFCTHIKKCGFIDLGFQGPAYTWTNKRFSSIPTYERLDRCLANAEWCMQFPSTVVYHLPMLHSDHSPILATESSSPNPHRSNKPFRFENWWLLEQDYREVAQRSWQRSTQRAFATKTKFLEQDLKHWRRKKPSNTLLLTQVENQLLEQQSLHPTLQNHTLQHHLHQQHQSLLSKEASYHAQRFKKTWATEGDRNTGFFHRAIIKRHRKNRIASLQNPNGTFATTPSQIASTLTNYFTSIFTSSFTSTTHPVTSTQPVSPVTNHLQSILQQQPNPNPASPPIHDTHQDSLFLFSYSTPTIKEIHDIIKGMRSNAAPGPDGLNAAFYKSSWSWINQDVYKVVMDFYSNAYLPSELNHTFISLIPKKHLPSIPQDFRPIGLCNVIYKIIAKSIANRIKDHLPDYISQNQSAFIANRHISSNIIITQEILHSFHLKSWKHHAFLLKIDLAKAFDRIEWSFISQALHRLGFQDYFINLVHTCISTPSLAILVNDEPTPFFHPQRGLRQGCPLSPYLFVLAINELSIRLQQELNNSNLCGVVLGEGAPPIHSLMFADDLILCGKATPAEAHLIKDILYSFCQQSGQTPNLQKSSIHFSRNVPTSTQHQIKGIFPVPSLQPNSLHLGHPLIFSHKDKNKAYHFIYNKFIAKLGTLKANNLNHAGRLQYIKSVLSSIPVYYMTTVLFSKSFTNKINAIIRRFWWAGIQEEQVTTPLAFRSWEDICTSTSYGGLGIRDIELINKSLLIHSAWNVATNKNPILTSILKAKYFPDTSFWKAPSPPSRSIYWSSIMQVKHHLHSNVTLQIHQGNSSIWSSPWTHIWANIHDHLLLPITHTPLPSSISDLWLQGTKDWNNHLLATTFDSQAVHQITATPVVPADTPDILRWIPSSKGICSTKFAYSYLADLIPHQLPTNGARSMSPAATHLLNKIWKAKTIPPFLKTFAWRLIRRALATAERASRFSSHIDKYCTSCGAIENDVHLFFLCRTPRQVWAMIQQPPLIHTLDANEDGVQLALTVLFPNDPPEYLLCSNLFLLWYIWRARNDNRFQRKSWSPLQVFRTANAHLQEYINTHQQQQDDPQQQGSRLQHQGALPPDVLRQQPQNPTTLLSCYTDAALQPDSESLEYKTAGIGIYFINMQENPPNFLSFRALATNVSSVIMAEAIALALASAIASSFNFQRVTFHTDSGILQQFIDSQDHSHPPDWRMKPFTQFFINFASKSGATILKIPRSVNIIADSLAKTALLLADTVHQPSSLTCSYSSHCNLCPLSSSLSSPFPCTLLLSALCA